MTSKSKTTNYAVQVCMPGNSYQTITRVTRDLSGKLDTLISIVNGTHKLSRKGMTVRVVAEESDATRINQSGMWRVVKRVKVA